MEELSMSLFESFVLGVVQAVTEFLPISSSGHLIIFPHLLNWAPQPLVFDIVLHFATVLAIIFYFRNDLLDIIKNLSIDFKEKKLYLNKYSREGKLGLYIVLGTIPAGIAGLLLEEHIENLFRSVLSVVIFLCAGSLLMLIAELYAKTVKNNSDLTAKKSIIIGFFQALALFSGVSRSGATISGGMLLNLIREQAARFSFLLSIPIVLGVSVVSITTNLTTEIASIGYAPVIIGFLSSFIFGLLAIKYLLQYLKTHTLYIFIIYRVLLAIFLLIFVV